MEAPWAEAPQYQNDRNTKQSKCHQTKNSNKYYSKNTNYSKPQSEVQTSLDNRGAFSFFRNKRGKIKQ